MMRLLRTLVLLFVGVSFSISAAEPVKIGVVIMHGKSGSPAKHVSSLASTLAERGVLVENIEMPWSGRRTYDVDFAAATREVEAAISKLREQGARKLFVAGHSQGGLFALSFGGPHKVSGIIAIAPGGNVSNTIYLEQLGSSVSNARQLITEGKGDEKTRLLDYESSKGTFPVITTPVIYLTWFEPLGGMNQNLAVKNMNPANPVLYIAPTNDYPGLRRVKQEMFDALPKNPLTRLYEPSATHLDAPQASASEILSWMEAVVSAP